MKIMTMVLENSAFKCSGLDGVRRYLGASLRMALLLSCPTVLAMGEIQRDDRSISVTTSRQVGEKREELIRFLWGSKGFPRTARPTLIITNVACPVQGLSNVRRVDEIRVRMRPDLEGMAYHFIPKSSNGQLVILHHGHGCTLDDDPSVDNRGYGLQRTIKALLERGCGVLGVYMPHMRPGDCTGGHEAMLDIKNEGNPMRLFLQTTALSLNHVKQDSRRYGFHRYDQFHMVGLSGGGWSTTVYSAVDPTIRLSFSVAGTIPLYLRSGGSIGDREQFEPSFYRLAGYPDLYVLGSYGRQRAQVQILNRRDDCCFGEGQHDPVKTGKPYETAMREFEADVRNTMKRLGQGAFQVEIDETSPAHMISNHAIQDVILPGLVRALK